MDIPAWAIQWVTPGGLIGLFVILIFTGRLVPRSTLLDAWRQRDRALETSEKLLEQNQLLINNNRIVNHFFGKYVPPPDGGDK